MQEDVQSINATEVHDEYTIDDDYLSDESEDIITDIHHVFYSTFGCTAARSKSRQINDDDTLDTTS